MLKKEISSPLVAWFLKNARDLPWRKRSDAYGIWVSEMMLQQTQVATVIPYYERWMEIFPNVEALARASEDLVMKNWAGLGYYRRARNLHAGAKMVVELFKGKFPETREELLKIPGIGAYSAGAILSIAFRKCEAALDGNLIRVYARLYAMEAAVDQAATLKKLWELAGLHRPLRADQSREFCEGMMELGATLCTPKNPKCLLCPLQNLCDAKRFGIQNQIPVKLKKIPRQKLFEEVIVSLRKNSQTKQKEIALLNPGADAKLASFYRLPFKKIETPPETYAFKTKYTITVRDYQVYVQKYQGKAKKNWQWFALDQLDQILVSTIDRKILRKASLMD